jgi:ActR/RegA family two-component response regulator
MMEAARPRFLMVDDDAAVQRCLARIVRRHGEVVAADTFERALALLSDGSTWTGFFFDIELPDGCGLALLVRAREQHPITPAMVLTGNNRDAAANAAYDLRAHYCIKPVATQRIEQFLKDATSLESGVSLVLRQWAARVIHALYRCALLAVTNTRTLRCLSIVPLAGALLSIPCSAACGGANEEAIGADLREAVPFYVCASLNAALAVGVAPDAGADGGPVSNPNAPLPDQLQIQLQATTTTTDQHQGQSGVNTVFVLQYTYQRQRQFANQHQVVIQYSDPKKIRDLLGQCNLGVARPTPVLITASDEGIKAAALPGASPAPPPPPTPEQICASAAITNCVADRTCHEACNGNHGCDESCSGKNNFAIDHKCWKDTTTAC